MDIIQSILIESMLSSVVSTTPTPLSTLLLDTSSSTEDESLSSSLSSLSSSSFTFNCLSFNGRSLVNKLADLRCLLDNESPDCVFVSETSCLQSSLSDNLLCCSDYNLYRKDRKKNRGSGDCTFIKAVYSSFLIDLPVECDDVELICTGFVCKNGSYIFVNVYRTPGFSIECKEYCNNLVNCLDYIATLYRISRLNNPVIAIIGDFNLPDVNWESRLAPYDSVQLKLSENFFDNRFILYETSYGPSGSIVSFFIIYIFLYINCIYVNEEPRDLVLDGI